MPGMKTLTKALVATAAGGLAMVFASPAFADATPECNNGAGAGSTECGSLSTTGAAVNATATGNLSTATGTSASAYGDRSFASGTFSTALGDFAAATATQGHTRPFTDFI